MLTDQDLARMNADGLREYIKTLHQALDHVGTAAIQAQRFINQSTTPTPKSNGSAAPSVAVAALAKALGNQ